MKLSALRLLLGIALVLVCLFYLEPSRAYQTSSPNATTPLQDQPKLKQIAQTIENSKKAGVRFETRYLFQSVNNQLTADTKLQQALSNGVKLSVDKSVIGNLLRQKIDYLTLPISDTKGGTVELELLRVNIFAPGFSVKTSLPTTETIQESLGVHYRGIVKGNTRSLAAISIFKNEIMGFYSTGAAGNTVIGRLGGNNPTDAHVLYDEGDLKVSPDFQCDVKEPPTSPPQLSLQDSLANASSSCVRLYLEADHSLFLNKGGVSETTSYLTGLFNQSATLFSNDGVSISLSEIFVWNSESPYDGTTSNAVLDQFKATRTSFNGDLAHLVTVNRRFGGIAFRGVLCFRSFAYGVSDVHSTFNNVPVYSWSVGVITHEVGHNLGSRHTHACAWNGDNTAIDGCAAPEGSCAQPQLPTDGGTIMSYCHLLPSVGINFTHGFGPQPKDVITGRIVGAGCLTNCSTDSQSFSVTVTASPINGGTVTGSGTFPAGSSSTVQATANSGFSFTSWTEGAGVVSSSSSYTFTLNSNRVLVANFTIETPPLQLLLEQSGSSAAQLAVLDSLLMRDPFAVVNAANPFNLTLDKNTRVVLFVGNLQLAPGEPPSAVVVNLVGSNNQSYDVTAEALVPLANSPFMQVTFRLPDNLASGTCTVIVKSHGGLSNAGTMRIK